MAPPGAAPRSPLRSTGGRRPTLKVQPACTMVRTAHYPATRHERLFALFVHDGACLAVYIWDDDFQPADKAHFKPLIASLQVEVPATLPDVAPTPPSRQATLAR